MILLNRAGKRLPGSFSGTGVLSFGRTPCMLFEFSDENPPLIRTREHDLHFLRDSRIKILEKIKKTFKKTVDIFKEM